MTFSIIARDPEHGLFGIAVSTAVPCVGVWVPHLRTGVGVIATQAHTNIRLGTDGLRLLQVGLSPEAALTALLQEDAEAARRQVAGIDNQGRLFVYSGDECVDWYGHRSGENYSVQGNMLVGQETTDAMAEAFERSTGFLPLRLLAALEAGQAAGGDKRGRESAALLAELPMDAVPRVNVRVDQHSDPVGELRRIVDLVVTRLQETLASPEREQAER